MFLVRRDLYKWFGYIVIHGYVLSSCDIYLSFILIELQTEPSTFHFIHYDASLDMNNLQGTLPTEIAALRSLSELHVYFNNIGGTLPTELGSLTSLSLLDLEVNQFEGDLFFSQLLNTSNTLQYLRGSDNKFLGSIPGWIGDFTGLKEFWAADNSLTGSIPTEVAQLTNLSKFAL